MGPAGTLGTRSSCVGGMLSTLGSGTGWCAVRCIWSCALVVAAFAAAIFVNRMLTFCSAYAVLPSRETVPFKTLVSSAAALMTSVSSVIWGFVIYLCLKNTLSLTLVALVFIIYTWKHR